MAIVYTFDGPSVAIKFTAFLKDFGASLSDPLENE